MNARHKVNLFKNRGWTWLFSLFLLAGACQQHEVIEPKADAAEVQAHAVKSEHDGHATCEVLDVPADKSNTNARTNKITIAYNNPYTYFAQSHIVLFIWEHSKVTTPFKHLNEYIVRTALKKMLNHSNVIFVYIGPGHAYYKDFKDKNPFKDNHSKQLSQFRNYIKGKFNVAANEYHALVRRNTGPGGILSPWTNNAIGGAAYLSGNYFISGYQLQVKPTKIWYSPTFLHELGHCLGAGHNNRDEIMHPGGVGGTTYDVQNYEIGFTAQSTINQIKARYNIAAPMIGQSRVSDFGSLSLTPHSSGSYKYYYQTLQTSKNTPNGPKWKGMYKDQSLCHYPNFLKFRVKTSGTYHIETRYARKSPTSSKFYDTYLYLLDGKTGNLIKRNDDKDWGTNRYESFISNVRLETGKDYYLVSAGYPRKCGSEYRYATSWGSYGLIVWYKNPSNQRRRVVKSLPLSDSPEFILDALPSDASERAAKAPVSK